MSFGAPERKAKQRSAPCAIGTGRPASRKSQGRGRISELAPDTRGYSLDPLDWDELNAAIDNFCAAFKAAEPDELPICPKPFSADPAP